MGCQCPAVLLFLQFEYDYYRGDDLQLMELMHISYITTRSRL